METLLDKTKALLKSHINDDATYKYRQDGGIEIELIKGEDGMYLASVHLTKSQVFFKREEMEGLLMEMVLGSLCGNWHIKEITEDEFINEHPI